MSPETIRFAILLQIGDIEILIQDFHQFFRQIGGFDLFELRGVFEHLLGIGIEKVDVVEVLNNDSSNKEELVETI